MELWEQPGARVSNLILGASRQEVEADDTSGALEKLNKLLTPEVAGRLRGRLIFVVNGYEEDPRDLWEMPEVRAWMRKLDAEWPYWFYFMDTGSQSTLSFLAFCLCRWEKVEGGKLIPPDDLERFLVRHYQAMGELARRLGLSKAESVARAREINAFFS